MLIIIRGKGWSPGCIRRMRVKERKTTIAGGIGGGGVVGQEGVGGGDRKGSKGRGPH